MHRCCVLIIILFFVHPVQSQTLGGNAVFQFLQQPNTAQLSALGGLNVSAIGQNVGMAFQNPALLRPDMHHKTDLSFNSFLAGISNYSLTTAMHLPNEQTSFGIGVNYFNYGSMAQTDASGNVLGSFSARDYVVQAMVSQPYKERWWYGMSLKFMHSGYGPYRSSGVAVDIGIAYYDKDAQWQASIVAKNMGTQLRTYDGSFPKEELPFDVEAGISKRLANAPFQFSLTLHHLHRFNIYYNDTSFRASEGDPNYRNSTTFQKIFSHVVLGTQLYLNEKISISAGYNFQRRQDLNAYNFTSGFNGFSLGTSLLLKKLHVHYATGFYQSNLFHHFSITL
jgi:hypothetical protein